MTGTIIDGAQLKVSGLQPGTYTSSETVPAGWTLTSITFDDEDSTGDLSTGTATFELQAGEIVTAVFTNTADQEPEPDPTKITITKETNPGSSNEFNFIDHDLNPFTLRDYNTEGDVWDQELEPGTYTFEELLEPGWTLDNININGDDDSGSIIDLPNRKITIDLDAEEWISVWFTNSKDPETGTIIVEKQTIPDGHTRDFDFTGDVSGTIRDGEQIVVSGLAPGTYTSTEIVPSNWKLDEITVDDDNSEVDKPNKKVTFKLEEGETIKAVFTNEKEDEPDPWEAKIKARKVDSNGDPIEGWMISLFQIDKYTNSNGWVEFTVVEPQTYTLIEETRSGWIPSGDTIVEITVTEEKTYTHTFRNEKVPDFVIPEYPLGTILSLITMMTALIISQNKHKIHL